MSRCLCTVRFPSCAVHWCTGIETGHGSGALDSSTWAPEPVRPNQAVVPWGGLFTPQLARSVTTRHSPAPSVTSATTGCCSRPAPDEDEGPPTTCTWIGTAQVMNTQGTQESAPGPYADPPPPGKDRPAPPSPTPGAPRPTRASTDRRTLATLRPLSNRETIPWDRPHMADSAVCDRWRVSGWRHKTGSPLAGPQRVRRVTARAPPIGRRGCTDIRTCVWGCCEGARSARTRWPSAPVPPVRHCSLPVVVVVLDLPHKAPGAGKRTIAAPRASQGADGSAPGARKDLTGHPPRLPPGHHLRSSRTRGLPRPRPSGGLGVTRRRDG